MLLLALCLTAPAARADKRDRQANSEGGDSSLAAKRLFTEGMKLFQGGKYDRALERFLRSSKLAPHANKQYNIAECYRRLGKTRQSHSHYVRYAASLPADQQAVFTEKLRKLRWGTACALSVSSSPAGASVAVDGKLMGITPAGGSPLTVTVVGGEHQIELRLAKHRPARRKLTAEFGEPQALNFALKPLPLPRPMALDVQTSVEPSKKSTLVAREPAEDSRLTARATPVGNGLFVQALLGPAWTDYGDDRLEASVATELGLRAGWLWRLGRLGVHLDAAVLAVPLADGGNDASGWFVSLLGGAGARWYLWRELWLGLRLGAGVSILSGAPPNIFLFEGSSEVSGSFPVFVLRPEVTAGWTFWRGLTLHLTPFALDYSPAHDKFTANIQHIMRYHVTAGLGWQM